MKTNASIYISIPILISILLFFGVFAGVDFAFNSTILFISCITVITSIDFIRMKLLKNINFSLILKKLKLNKTNYYLTIAWFVLISVFCMLDLYFHGLVILHPETYYAFTPFQAQLRHISLLCWTLIPFALLIIEKRSLMLIFILIAVVFPILVLDRNRFLASSTAAIFCLFFFDELIPILWKRVLTITLIAILSLCIFSKLGHLRSGELDFIKNMQISSHVKTTESFNKAPEVIKWPVLYATSSFLNFSYIEHTGYRDVNYLKMQLLHNLGAAQQKSLTQFPLIYHNFNVGTEFLPFLLFNGISAVIIAFICVYLFYFSSLVILKYFDWSIFSLLIYFRVLYCCIMLNFAPQLFTWTTFGFIFICLAAIFGQSILGAVFSFKNRNHSVRIA